MSGSAALASARRRRASVENTPPQRQQSNEQPNTQPNSNLEVKLTPLEILKHHDELINNMEDNIVTNISEIIDVKLKFYTDNVV